MQLKGRKFVVIGPQRTGSTMLVRALNTLPNFLVHDEVFVLHGGNQRSATFKEWAVEVIGKKLERVKRDNTPSHEFHDLIKCFTPGGLIYDFLDHLYKPAEKGSFVGFKVMYNQLDMFPDISRYIMYHGLFRIHLLRKDPIKRAISGYLKDARLSMGFTRSQLDQEPQKDVKVSIDPEELWSNIKSTRIREDHYRKYFGFKGGKRYKEFYYEDLIGDDPVVDSRLSTLGSATLQEFLDVEEVKRKIPIHVPIRKQSHDDLRQCIENYDEIVDFFSKDDKDRRSYLKWFPGG